MLGERKSAGLPPFGYQALLTAEARSIDKALAFLSEAVESIPQRHGVTVNEPIPMTMMRVANMERAQLLIESASRPALQRMLKEWLPVLRDKKSVVRWQIEVDPMTI